MKSLFTLLMALAFATIGFAQDSLMKKERMHEKMHEKMHYICPMHADVMQDHPGKCPKCGMDLVKTKNHDKMYCPMCKENTVMKDGKCTKCGKKITKYGEKGQAKKMYMCSSCHTKSKKSGKCPKCGADIHEMK
jgi:predicted RNA-binding Zn-ribbon protein involved in translation (DUF1610 family)